MAYEKQTWNDGEEGGTPLSAERLNHIEDGIATIDGNLPFRLGIDEDGNYGYYKDGADTVTPFKTGGGGDTPFAWNTFLLGSTTLAVSDNAMKTVSLSDNAKDYDFLIVSFNPIQDKYAMPENNLFIVWVGKAEELEEQKTAHLYHSTTSGRTEYDVYLKLISNDQIGVRKVGSVNRTFYIYGINKKTAIADTLIAYYESDTKVDNTNQSYHRSEFPLVYDDGTISYDSSTKEFIVNKSCNLLVWGLVGQIGGASNTRGNTKMYVNDVEVGNTDSYWSNEPAKIVYTGSFNVGDRIRVWNNTSSWNTVASMMFYRVSNVPTAATLNVEDE